MLPIYQWERYSGLIFNKKHMLYTEPVNDEYYATDGFCTHGNAHLAEGAVIGDIIECHKHNGRFNIRDGTPMRMPVTVGIKTYKVEVYSEKVILNLAGPSRGNTEAMRNLKKLSGLSATGI